MRPHTLSIIAVVSALITGVFFCTKVVNPIEKYENVSAELKANRIFWKAGARDSISVRVFAANLVESMVIDFGENGEDTTMIRSNGPDHPTDTITLAHTYTLAGVKPICARANLKNGEIEQSDTLYILVGAQPDAPQAITVTDTPKIGRPFYIAATTTGSDTLKYQWFKNGSAIAGGIAATLSMPPLTINDTGAYYCIITNAWGADTTGAYTLTFTPAQNHAPEFGLYQSSRAVKVNQALTIGLAATDPDHDALTFALLNESGFGAGEITKTVTPDSIRIVFTPADTGTRELKITASDGTLSDIATISVQVDPANVNSKPIFAAFDSMLTDTLNKALVFTLQATDADLTPLTFRLLDSASFAAGEVSASTATNSMTVTFTPKTSGARLIRISVSDGSLLDTARIHVAVVERDSIAPVIRLVNQNLDNSSTNTNYALIECIVTDDKAVNSVAIISGTVLFPIKNNNDSSFIAEVNGLQAGVFTTITIRAIDRAGNSSSKVVHIKYDPTMADLQKPQIILLAPISPTAVAAATVIAKVKDASDVAEVKINGTAVTSTDGLFSRQITLVSGDNSVTVYAKDASANANDTTVTFTIKYDSTYNKAKALTAFRFSSLAAIGVIDTTNKTVTVSVPFGTALTALVATFSTTGASVIIGTTIQVSGTTPNTFTAPVTYTVNAADGTTRDYIVTVNVAQNPAKAITAFSFTNLSAIGVIDTGSKMIVVNVPSGTPVTALIPTIIHTGASISPLTGVAQNFSNLVTYTVTAADGTTQPYVVSVVVALNSAKAIKAFSFASLSVAGTIDPTAKTISVDVPYGTAVNYLTPTITHTGASISPSVSDPQNFTSPVTYTVTAADESTQAYSVTVTIATPSTNANLSSLTVNHGTLTPAFSAATADYTVNVANSVESITVTGTKAESHATVSANSGVSQSLTVGANTITLTVTAQDGTTIKNYVVTVNRAGKPITFANLTANGTPWSETTTVLTLTFDDVLTGLTGSNITVTGATEGTLTGSGTTRTLLISGITVANGGNVTVAISNPTDFIIAPSSLPVAVNVRTTYSITYSGNGNTGGDVPVAQTKVHGQPITLALRGNLARTAFNFVSWNAAADSSGLNYADGAIYSANAPLTLYAKWANWIVTETTLTDPDGNVYTTVVIGTQTWMKQNLKTTKYNDGSSIPGPLYADTDWGPLITHAYCYYQDNPSYLNTYGALYNWYAVNNPKIAPIGWHVPDTTEWKILINYHGGGDVAGKNLKEAGVEHWTDPYNPNTGTDLYHFTALPGGYRGNGGGNPTFGSFVNINSMGVWWSSNEVADRMAVNCTMYSSFDVVYSYRDIKMSGYSVRLIKN
jgi:uncharacterized protein (TIGR02145 family)